MSSFAALWALRKRDGDPSYMDSEPLDQSAPAVAMPNTANGDLSWQANRQIEYNGQNRRNVEEDLAESTARRPATVTTPDPSMGSSSGFGGGGYSGANATQLGTKSDGGTYTPAANPPQLQNQV